MASNDNVTIDLQNYKDRLGSHIPEGRYRVVVDDAELDEARSGNKMINLWFRVLEGESEGATIIDRLVQAPNSLFRTVGFMQAIGLPTPKKRLQINLRQFIGKVLEVDVSDGDPYQGRVKSEVRGYIRVASKATEEAEDLPEDEDEEQPPLEAAETTDDVELDGVDL